MTDREIETIVEVARQRNEMEFLFQITKAIAESDSIGEGYHYRPEYTQEDFNNGERYGSSFDEYLQEGGAPVYQLYLNHIHSKADAPPST